MEFIISGKSNKIQCIVGIYNVKRQQQHWIQTKDQGGLSFEKVFTIAVTNTNALQEILKLGANTFK